MLLPRDRCHSASPVSPSIEDQRWSHAIESFFSLLQKDSDSESLRYSTALMTALEDTAVALGDSAASLGDSAAAFGDSAEVIGDSAAVLGGTRALGTMGDSGVF